MDTKAVVKIVDPTAEEMRAAVNDMFPIAAGGGNDFDLKVAMYWFATNHHCGQDSNLYRLLSEGDYKPGILEDGPHRAGVIAGLFYDILRERFVEGKL